MTSGSLAPLPSPFEQVGAFLLVFGRVIGTGGVAQLLQHGRELRAHPSLESRPIGVGHQVIVNRVQVLTEGTQQGGAGGVLQLGAQGQIVAHTVLADAHQRPLVADQRDAFRPA